MLDLHRKQNEKPQRLLKPHDLQARNRNSQDAVRFCFYGWTILHSLIPGTRPFYPQLCGVMNECSIEKSGLEVHSDFAFSFVSLCHMFICSSSPQFVYLTIGECMLYSINCNPCSRICQRRKALLWNEQVLIKQET